MNTYDLRGVILQYLEIDDLSIICFTDKMSEKISPKFFWTIYFESHGLPIPKENLTNPIAWLKLFRKYQKIHDRTNIILYELSGPIKVMGYENTFRSSSLVIENLDNLMIHDKRANDLLIAFVNQFEKLNKLSYRLIIFYRDGYYLQLDGNLTDSSLSFSDMLTLSNNTQKTAVYKISKDIAYQYLFILLYHQLHGIN